MSKQIKAPRGTQDISMKDIEKIYYVEKMFLDICKNYGFKELRTPTFEYTELYLRGVGDTTDVVSKEMYTFLDKSDRSITLKPEGTAGVIRSLLETGVINDGLPVKVCYSTPCFRYDKPQAGRLREFHQFGVEIVGSGDASSDVQVIKIAYDYLKKLDIKDIKLEINSIGCPKCRPKYNEEMLNFLNSQKEHLCNTCNERLEKNPMRVLDCKEEGCKEITKNAPKTTDNLCIDCDTHFNDLKKKLDILDVKYKINSKIVRGLDYYTKTVFEFTSESLGSQSTVCGGGRYDGLVTVLGGKDTPSVGFAMGVERLLIILENQGKDIVEVKTPDLYIVNVGVDVVNFCYSLADDLRQKDLWVETDLMGRSLKSQMKYADKIKAKFTIVIGEEEITSKKVKLKNMEDGSTLELDIKMLFENIKVG
ncbi:MAG: histidine--tRNA ligase [Oscillospiraceae bacterium]